MNMIQNKKEHYCPYYYSENWRRKKEKKKKVRQAQITHTGVILEKR